MRKLKDIEIDVLIVRGVPGSHQTRAFHEAAILCLEENVNVLLFFNDKQYQFTFNELISTYEEVSKYGPS